MNTCMNNMGLKGMAKMSYEHDRAHSLNLLGQFDYLFYHFHMIDINSLFS